MDLVEAENAVDIVARCDRDGADRPPGLERREAGPALDIVELDLELFVFFRQGVVLDFEIDERMGLAWLEGHLLLAVQNKVGRGVDAALGDLPEEVGVLERGGGAEDEEGEVGWLGDVLYEHRAGKAEDAVGVVVARNDDARGLIGDGKLAVEDKGELLVQLGDAVGQDFEGDLFDCFVLLEGEAALAVAGEVLARLERRRPLRADLAPAAVNALCFERERLPFPDGLGRGHRPLHQTLRVVVCVDVDHGALLKGAAQARAVVFGEPLARTAHGFGLAEHNGEALAQLGHLVGADADLDDRQILVLLKDDSVVGTDVVFLRGGDAVRDAGLPVRVHVVHDKVVGFRTVPGRGWFPEEAAGAGGEVVVERAALFGLEALAEATHRVAVANRPDGVGVGGVDPFVGDGLFKQREDKRWLRVLANRLDVDVGHEVGLRHGGGVKRH